MVEEHLKIPKCYAVTSKLIWYVYHFFLPIAPGLQGGLLHLLLDGMKATQGLPWSGIRGVSCYHHGGPQPTLRVPFPWDSLITSTSPCFFKAAKPSFHEKPHNSINSPSDSKVLFPRCHLFRTSDLRCHCRGFCWVQKVDLNPSERSWLRGKPGHQKEPIQYGWIIGSLQWDSTFQEMIETKPDLKWYVSIWKSGICFYVLLLEKSWFN